MSEEYECPCQNASPPYWKAKETALPQGLRLNMLQRFGAEDHPEYQDTPISVCGTRRDLSRLLRSRLHFPLAYTHRNVYVPKLWIALKESATGRRTGSEDQ